ncbi:MAG TPA: hypothetical protein VMI31_06100 [Fimbriimonadaceae bacterium]|nr:hypothetical protein [Fimbriimonadaceae bacterium]
MSAKIALCTLYEGDYHYGVAALANSLHAAGFMGNLWVGTRGERPPWMLPGSKDLLELDGGMRLEFVDIDTLYHFSHYKPWWIRRVLEDLDSSAQTAAYIDPDIVVKAPWQFFEDWTSWGISLVGDFFEAIPHNHLFRHHWRRLCAERGWSLAREDDRYYNCGFVGVPRTVSGFLGVWADLLEALPSLGLPIDQLLPTDALHPFRFTDQDLLNACLECGTWPMATLPPSAMDLRGQVGDVMCHMTPGAKPWRTGYFLGPKRWRERSHAGRQYWSFVDGPIRPYARGERLVRTLDQKAAAVLGRVYSVPGWKP